MIARIPASSGKEHVPSVAFIAHLDTAGDVSGKDVKAVFVESYNGDIIQLAGGHSLNPNADSDLAGQKGKRFALTHSRVMIHQPMGGMQGQASDMEITVKEILKVKQELYKIISDHSGKSIEQVERDSDRDYWMTSAEAKEYGMIDDILARK